MSDAEHLRTQVDDIERAMMDEPERIEVLRAERAAVLDRLRAAEAEPVKLERELAAESGGEQPRRPVTASGSATENAREEIARLERAGEIEPWAADRLRAVLDEADAAVTSAQATMSQAMAEAVAQAAEVSQDKAEEWRKQTVAEKIRDWDTVKVLRRSEMSAKQKSYVLRRFGKQAYASLKW